MNFITGAKSLKVSIADIDLVRRWNMFTAAKDRLASGLDSHPGVLDLLARRGSSSVQRRVAGNRSANSVTLDLLSHHQSADVRSAVAQNANTRESTKHSLVADSNADVRYAMADNPSTCSALLEILAVDDNPFVQDRAKKTRAQLKVELIKQGCSYSNLIPESKGAP